MKTRARGKFLHHGEEKIFLKAIRATGGDVEPALLKSAGANTVWLEDPTPERIDLFLAQGFYVVPDLGFREALRARFAGGHAGAKAWRERAERCLRHCAGLPKVIAFDLGAGHSAAPRKLLGRWRWRRLVRRALIDLRRHSGGKPLTCTVAVHREGGRYELGPDVSVADIFRTFRQLFGWPVDFVSVECADDDLTEARNFLSRLQVLCYDLPLVAHLRPWSSGSHSLALQARSLDGQIRNAFNTGCAGVVIARWRDGADECGLVDSRGKPKPALPVAAAAFADTPFSPTQIWPAVSIVICAFNSGDTLEDCLAGCAALDYPDFEVIVVVDRSRDESEAIAARWSAKRGFKVIVPSENRGLSAARNAGARAASGEIVAYLDADAFPDRDWLRYLGTKFLQSKFAVIGGPNLNPLEASEISDCVDKAPGNPGLVMLDNEACDHVAGCNLAIRREFLDAIGGFTDAYRAGGDDVTLCWRTIVYGGALGFAPGAMVWHYRRWTVGQFLRQQRTYGKGETALERDWPERYNSLGHAVAPDRLPGWKRTQPAHFGGMYQPFSSGAAFLLGVAKLPEFFLLNLALLFLAASSLLWPGLWVFAPLSGGGLALWLVPALIEGWRAPLRKPTFRLRAITAFLFLAQPLARARGRWGDGMTPWRDRLPRSALPSNGRMSRGKAIAGFARRCLSAPLYFPSAAPVDPEPHDFQRTLLLEESAAAGLFAKLRLLLVPVNRGAGDEAWHVQVEGGAFAGTRGSFSASFPAAWRFRPYVSRVAKGLFLGLAALGGIALYARAWPIAALAFAGLGWVTVRASRQGLAALDEIRAVLAQPGGPSLWKRFQPPRYFFVDLAPPQDRARAHHAVPGDGKLVLQRGHLDEQRNTVTGGEAVPKQP